MEITDTEKDVKCYYLSGKCKLKPHCTTITCPLKQLILKKIPLTIPSADNDVEQLEISPRVLIGTEDG